MKNETIRIAITDDHPLFRKGLRSMLESESGMQVVFEASSGNELLQLIKHQPVDVVLMDVEMPEMDGIEATRQLRESMPDVRSVILSAHKNNEMIEHAFEKGARGYLFKDSDPDELIEAIKTVMQNGFCFNNDVSNRLLKSIAEKKNFQSLFNPSQN